MNVVITDFTGHRQIILSVQETNFEACSVTIPQHEMNAVVHSLGNEE